MRRSNRRVNAKRSPEVHLLFHLEAQDGAVNAFDLNLAVLVSLGDEEWLLKMRLEYGSNDAR